MKRILLAIVIWNSAGLAAAQPESMGQLEVFYQRIQGFDFFSGDPSFDIQGENFNGGGFGFVYNVTGWFGLFSETALYGGVEQSGLKMKLINQVQGVRVTAREVGPFNFFAKGGMGFVRFVFESPFFGEGVDFGAAFGYGGGAEVRLKEGLLLVIDGGRQTMRLPTLTNNPERDKWDSNFVLTTGIAFQF